MVGGRVQEFEFLTSSLALLLVVVQGPQLRKRCLGRWENQDSQLSPAPSQPQRQGQGAASQSPRGANLSGAHGNVPFQLHPGPETLKSPGEKARWPGSRSLSQGGAWSLHQVPGGGAPGWKELVIRPLGEWKGWSGREGSGAVSCTRAGLRAGGELLLCFSFIAEV